jgi:hypothetical protein
MLVALNTSIIGVLAVADQAKREAASTVAALHKLGLQVHSLLTYCQLFIFRSSARCTAAVALCSACMTYQCYVTVA